MAERRSIVFGVVGRSGDGGQARHRAARRRIRETLAVRRADAAAGLRTGTPDGSERAGETGVRSANSRRSD